MEAYFTMQGMDAGFLIGILLTGITLILTELS